MYHCAHQYIVILGNLQMFVHMTAKKDVKWTRRGETKNLVSCIIYIFMLFRKLSLLKHYFPSNPKMVAPGSFQMFEPTYQTTWHHTLKDCSLISNFYPKTSENSVFFFKCISFQDTRWNKHAWQFFWVHNEIVTFFSLLAEWQVFNSHDYFCVMTQCRPLYGFQYTAIAFWGRTPLLPTLTAHLKIVHTAPVPDCWSQK